MHKKLCIYSALFIISLTTWSQKSTFVAGYIVKQNGDSISGLIKSTADEELLKRCEFKRKGKKNVVKTFTSEELAEFGIYDERRFVSSSSKPFSDQGFVEVLIVGKASVYYTEKGYFLQLQDTVMRIDNDRIATDDKRERLLRKRTGNYKKMLSAYLVNECFELNSRLGGVNLAHRSLTRFVERYHNCIGTKYKRFYNQKSSVKLESVLIGANSSFLVSSNYENNGFQFSEFSSDPQFAVIARARIRIPKLGKQLSVVLDGGYMRRRYESIYQEILSPASRSIYDSKFSFGAIRFSPKIGWIPSSKNASFEFQIGPYVDIIGTITDQETERTFVSNGVVTRGTVQRFNNFKEEYGITMSLVKQLNIFDNDFLIEGNYSYGGGFLRTYEISSTDDFINKTHTFFVGFGYMF